MASRRFRGRPSSRDRFERREETFENRGYEEPGRFRNFDAKGREIPNIRGREERPDFKSQEDLTARDRIRIENQEFDRKRHRSSSRNRRPSPGHTSHEKVPKEHSRSRSHRSRSPKRSYNGERSGHSRERRGRSRERHGHSREAGGHTREVEMRDRVVDRGEVRFEPPDHRYGEIGDGKGGRYAAFATEERSRMGNRFSPPAPVEFPDGNVEMELKPKYNTEDYVEYPDIRMYRGGPAENSDVAFMDKNISRNDNIPSLMDRQGFPPNQSGFADNPQEHFMEQRSQKDFQDADTPLIPEFNPELSRLSSYEWIRLVEDTAKQYEWQKDEKQYIMASRLAGYARQWYLTAGVRYKTWNDLKFAFLQAFPTEMSYFNLLQKMIARVKEDTESMTSYFHHKVALLNACEIQGRKAVSCIIGGLQNKSVQMKAKAQNFEDPDELYLFLRSNDAESLPVEVKNEKDKPPIINKKCFICKEVGHIKSQCPNRPKGERDPREDKKEPSMFNKVMHGSLSRAPTFHKYFTEININGITLKAYVDQTSECTTIRQATANHLKLPVKKDYKVIRGFAGNSFSSIGIVEVPLCIDRAIANVQLCVIPDHLQAIPVIVGQNFTEQSHIVIMKDGEKVRFYQRMDNGKTNFDF
ncbi:hypothetical protein ILUMI_02608 [Ignelater luminosus]|uniref:CCHC-type domain-containing protein n=1 Tax=Ignelater luminosus TaxID=2038154 RepID=A0A8K0DHZ1_IGNLU|nr:hypothetical protein ILUMI_02608 [Ignelater luminosus]